MRALGRVGGGVVAGQHDLFSGQQGDNPDPLVLFVLQPTDDVACCADIVRDVQLLVFDEVHYLSDPERGVVWEEAMILAPSTCRFVLLSASISNGHQLAQVRSLRLQPPSSPLCHPAAVRSHISYVYHKHKAGAVLESAPAARARAWVCSGWRTCTAVLCMWSAPTTGPRRSSTMSTQQVRLRQPFAETSHNSWNVQAAWSLVFN